MTMDKEDNKEMNSAALEQLVKIADRMEDCDDPQEMKQLQRDYRAASIAAGITDANGNLKDKGWRHTPAQLKESRAKALAKVKEYLDDIRTWEVKLPELQSGSVEYIIVSCLVNFKGMACEINLEIPDGIYSNMTKTSCYKARKSLVSQNQLKTYASIEQGLIAYGLDVCLKGIDEKREFFQKYAVPYNKRLTEEKLKGE